MIPHPHHRGRGNFSFHDFVVWLLFISVSVAAITWAIVRANRNNKSDAPESPIGRTVPPFSMTDQFSRPFDSRSLDGRYWIVDFIFTNCAGPCPIMSRTMSRIQDQLRDIDNVRLISISVDPARDTPEVLNEYSRLFNADPDRWLLLTGSYEQTQRLAIDGFSLLVQTPSALPTTSEANRGVTDATTSPPEPPHTGPILHSTKFVLVSDAGTIIDYFSGTDPDDIVRLASTVRSLAVIPPWRAFVISVTPPVNAAINAVAAVLLVIGLVLIKRRRIEAHRNVMISAFTLSVIFLILYVTHHYLRGSLHTPWQIPGWSRIAYYTFLISHFTLAATVPILAPITIRLGLKRRDKSHRRLARITWPIWFYVSVTGVLVYILLYHVQPWILEHHPDLADPTLTPTIHQP